MAHSLQSFDLSGFSGTSDAPPLGTIPQVIDEPDFSRQLVVGLPPN
jgi:hypothetical protein